MFKGDFLIIFFVGTTVLTIIYNIIVLKHIRHKNVMTLNMLDNLDESIIQVNKNLDIVSLNKTFETKFNFSKSACNIKELSNRGSNIEAKHTLGKISHALESNFNTAQSFGINTKFAYLDVHIKPTCNGDYAMVSIKDTTQHHWQLIEILTRIVDAKNPYTCGHSFRVARYASWIAYKLNMEIFEIILAWECGIAHDIGKLAIPDSILNSSNILTPEERKIVDQHSGQGANILECLYEFSDIHPIIRYHHERIDGKGPLHISDEQIPLLSRIISVADVFDSMTSGRPYQKKPCKEAHETINQLLDKGDIGTQLCFTCFNAFVEALLIQGYVSKNDDGIYTGTNKIFKHLYKDENDNLQLKLPYKEDFDTEIDALYKLLTQGLQNN